MAGVEISLASELLSAMIGYFTGLPLEHGKNTISRWIHTSLFTKNIQKKAKQLQTTTYKDFFTPQKGKLDIEYENFSQWLVSETIIEKLIAFHVHQDDRPHHVRVSLSREDFYLEAYRMAGAKLQSHRDGIKRLLDDVFGFVGELLNAEMDWQHRWFYRKIADLINDSAKHTMEQLLEAINYKGSFAEYVDMQNSVPSTLFDLDYRSDTYPFWGREDERRQIRDFCFCDGTVSWWAIIGGGSGKSRLALQYIMDNQHTEEWKMMFLEKEFFHQENSGGKYCTWNTWRYDRNLLFVVDYVQRYAKEVAEWIESLCVNGSVTRKIRILILEREGGQNALWYRNIFDRRILAVHGYKPFLFLQPLSSEQLVSLAQQVHTGITREKAKQAFGHLADIDDQKRLLYFIMILNALSGEENENWRDWNKPQLAKYITKREIDSIDNRFRGHERVLRQYKQIFAFCTATDGISVDVPSLWLPDFVKKALTDIQMDFQDTLSMAKTLAVEGNRMEPFTPDIVGEYMVLLFLHEYCVNDDEKTAFIQGAWKYAPNNFSFFLLRIVQDNLCSQDELPDYFKWTEKMFQKPDTSDRNVLMAYCRLMSALVASQSPLSGLYCLCQLQELCENFPDNPCIVSEYARGLVHYLQIQDAVNASMMIQRLEKLACDYSDSEEIVLEYAKGLVELLYKQEEAAATLKKLEVLAGDYSASDEIALLYADGLVRILSSKEEEGEQMITTRREKLDGVYRYHNRKAPMYNKSKQEEAEALCIISKLEKLVKEHSHHEKMALLYAEGLVHLSMKQQAAEAFVTLQKVEGLLQQDYDQKNEMLMVYAKGLAAVTCGQETADALVTIEMLGELAAQNPDNIHIALEYARGLSEIARKQEDVPEAAITMRRLEKLAGDYPFHSEIVLAYAKGLMMTAPKQGVQNIQEMNTLLCRLEELTSLYPDDEGIAIEFAKGLVNAIAMIGQEASEALRMLSKLEKIAGAYPCNDEAAIVYASGLAVGSVHQETEEARHTIQALEDLAGHYPDNERMAHAYAMGLVNFISERDGEEIVKSVCKLEKLFCDYPNNKDIAFAYAMGLSNLSKKLEAQEAFETVSRLAIFSADHPHDKEVAYLLSASLFDLSNKQMKNEAVHTIEKLEKLAHDFSDDESIILNYAKGLVNLQRTQETEEAFTIICKLKKLVDDHPGNESIAIQYAKGLANLSIRQEEPHVSATISRLEKLTSDYPGREEFVFLYAVGLYHLFFRQDDEAGTQTMRKLEQMSVDYSYNEDIVSLYFRALHGGV